MKSLDKTDVPSGFTAPAGDALPPQIQPRDAEIIRLTEIIRSQDIKIQALAHEVAYLRRIRYGVKSEAMSPEQRQLFDEDIVQDIAAVESELNLPATPAAPRSRAGRQVLPEHLERVEVRHEPEFCTCPACQSNLVKIGEDVSEQLDVEPARFFVIRHIAQDLQRERNRQEKADATDTPDRIQKSLADSIGFLVKQLADLQQVIDDHIDKHPSLKKDMALLQSIPAVGPQVGGNMLSAETGSGLLL